MFPVPVPVPALPCLIPHCFRFVSSALVAWRVLLFLRIYEFYNLATLDLSALYHLFPICSELAFEFLLCTRLVPVLHSFHLHATHCQVRVHARERSARGRVGATVDGQLQPTAAAWPYKNPMCLWFCGISSCLRWRVQEHWCFACSAAWAGALWPISQRAIQVRVQLRLICRLSLLRHQLQHRAIVMGHRSNRQHPSQTMERPPSRQPSRQPSRLHHHAIATARRPAIPARVICRPRMQALQEQQVEGQLVDRTYPLLSRNRSSMPMARTR